MKNILVTGANGQLGNSLRDIAAGSNNRYIFTDVNELDITDRDAVNYFIKKHTIDVIINCAAYTNVDKAEEDKNSAELINNQAVKNLALAAKENNATLIHISTDYVFSGIGNTPCTEEQPTAPLGVYGKTKLDGEKSLLETGCRHIIIRTSWLYSPYGKNFVKTMQTLTAEKKSIKVVFDQIGTPTYAADLAGVIYHIVENDKLQQQGIYHYSNEGVCSWYDFAKEICEISGNKCDIRPCHSDEFPSKVTRPHYSVLDKTKIKNTFGVKIPYWKDSLRRCIQTIKTNNNQII